MKKILGMFMLFLLMSVCGCDVWYHYAVTVSNKTGDTLYVWFYISDVPYTETEGFEDYAQYQRTAYRVLPYDDLSESLTSRGDEEITMLTTFIVSQRNINEHAASDSVTYDRIVELTLKELKRRGNKITYP